MLEESGHAREQPKSTAEADVPSHNQPNDESSDADVDESLPQEKGTGAKRSEFATPHGQLRRPVRPALSPTHKALEQAIKKRLSEQVKRSLDLLQHAEGRQNLKAAMRSDASTVHEVNAADTDSAASDAAEKPGDLQEKVKYMLQHAPPVVRHDMSDDSTESPVPAASPPPKAARRPPQKQRSDTADRLEERKRPTPGALRIDGSCGEPGLPSEFFVLPHERENGTLRSFGIFGTSMPDRSAPPALPNTDAHVHGQHTFTKAHARARALGRASKRIPSWLGSAQPPKAADATGLKHRSYTSADPPRECGRHRSTDNTPYTTCHSCHLCRS
jgi:hypothetical protein